LQEEEMSNLILKARIIEQFGSQTVLARQVGLSEDRLSKIIHGRVPPKDHEKRVIAESLGLSEREIFPA
jgi:lambda repressor-like predicted transcriptional regulator